MWLYNENWELLTVGAERKPVPINTLIALTHACSPTLQERFSMLDSLDHLQAMQREMIMGLGSRRYCKMRGAEAIMSVLGVKNWFVATKTAPGDGEGDLVLGQYPLAFVRETASAMGTGFFNSLSFSTAKLADIANGPPPSYRGSLMPFNSSASDATLTHPEQEVGPNGQFVEEEEHPSVACCAITQEGAGKDHGTVSENTLSAAWVDFLMIRVGHLEVFIDIYTINGSVFGTGNNKIEEPCPEATSLPKETLSSVRLSLRPLVWQGMMLGQPGTNDDRAPIYGQLGTDLNQMELPNPFEEWEDSLDPDPGNTRTPGDAYIPYRPPGHVNTQAPSHSVAYSRAEYAELYDKVDRLTRHSKSHTSTKTDSLEDVSGINWEVPAIDPILFTPAEFARVLRRASEMTSCDLIWVDIACINQTVDSPEKAKEIGRQARIFQNAHQAFIWLLSEQKEPDRSSAPYEQSPRDLFCLLERSSLRAEASYQQWLSGNNILKLGGHDESEEKK
ncbi:hypothetical protein AUP68_03759 [Ilyonectria robusta]